MDLVKSVLVIGGAAVAMLAFVAIAWPLSALFVGLMLIVYLYERG